MTKFTTTSIDQISDEDRMAWSEFTQEERVEMMALRYEANQDLWTGIDFSDEDEGE